jgi:hypothetical protein
MAAKKSLSKLPVDIQASILAFLACGDLARFCVVSHACRSMAIMDRLWRPLMVRHFADVQHVSRGHPSIMTMLMDLWSSLFHLFHGGSTPQIACVESSSVFHFRALALSNCSLCEEFLLPIAPKSETTHPRPHSCDACKSLCCAACHCQCHLEVTNHALQVLPPFDLYGLPYPAMLALLLIEAHVRFYNAILSELDYF